MYYYHTIQRSYYLFLPLPVLLFQNHFLFLSFSGLFLSLSFWPSFIHFLSPLTFFRFHFFYSTFSSTIIPFISPCLLSATRIYYTFLPSFPPSHCPSALSLSPSLSFPSMVNRMTDVLVFSDALRLSS